MRTLLVIKDLGPKKTKLWPFLSDPRCHYQKADVVIKGGVVITVCISPALVSLETLSGRTRISSPAGEPLPLPDVEKPTAITRSGPRITVTEQPSALRRNA